MSSDKHSGEPHVLFLAWLTELTFTQMQLQKEPWFSSNLYHLVHALKTEVQMQLEVGHTVILGCICG